MRVVRKLITVVTVFLFAWIAVSFIQVNVHNKLGADPMTPEQKIINVFCIYSRMLN